MKKITGLVLGLFTFVVMCTGCSSDKSKEINANKVITDNTAQCNWFDSDNVEDSYMLDKISFSKDNNIAVLSYTTMKMGAKLDE